MLHEFQEEIARLKAELASAGGGDGAAGSGGCANAAATLQGSSHQDEALFAGGLDPEEVTRMRQQLEEDLRAEHNNHGADLDAATLEQVGAHGQRACGGLALAALKS